jgi:hypothetical protein
LPKKLKFEENAMSNGNAVVSQSTGYSGISGLDPPEFLIKLDFEKLVKMGSL